MNGANSTFQQQLTTLQSSLSSAMTAFNGRMQRQDDGIAGLIETVNALKLKVEEQAALLLRALPPKTLVDEIDAIGETPYSDLLLLWNRLRALSIKKLEELWLDVRSVRGRTYLEWLLCTKANFQARNDKLRAKLATKSALQVNAQGFLEYRQVAGFEKNPDHIPQTYILSATEAAANVAALLSGGKMISQLLLKRDTPSQDALLFDTLQHSRSISWLALELKRCSKEDAEQVAKAFKAAKSLLKLEIETASLEPDSAEVLLQALKENRSIEDLTLDVESFKNASLKNLAEALVDHPSMKTFRVLTGEYTEEVSGQLAALIAKTTTLTTLHLIGSKIETPAAQKLRDALIANSSISTLDFAIQGDAGALALAEVVDANQKISAVYIDERHFGKEIGTALSTILNANSAIRSVSLVRRVDPKDILDEIKYVSRDPSAFGTPVFRNSMGCMETKSGERGKLIESLNRKRSLKQLIVRYTDSIRKDCGIFRSDWGYIDFSGYARGYLAWNELAERFVDLQQIEEVNLLEEDLFRLAEKAIAASAVVGNSLASIAYQPGVTFYTSSDSRNPIPFFKANRVSRLRVENFSYVPQEEALGLMTEIGKVGRSINLIPPNRWLSYEPFVNFINSST